MPTITITSPQSGDTVNSPFTVSGTYTTSDPIVAIAVTLKDSAGTAVAIGTPITVGAGQWAFQISADQSYTDATVVATLQTASDSVGNLTVNA